VASASSAVRDIRGLGLMAGIEFQTHEQANAVERAAFERGLLVLECGESTLRMCPPLVVDGETVDTALAIFGEALAAVRHPQPGHEETGG